MAAPNPNQTPKKSYYSNKNNLIKWILIYLVIGGLIYAAIYFLFLNGNSSGSSATLPY